MAADAQALTVRRVDPEVAAQALAGCESLDPRGLSDTEDLLRMCHEGQCFAIDGQAAQAVYVLQVRNGVVWVDALRGSGTADLVELVDSVLTHQAEGLQAIACQTARRGLRTKLERRGYRVTGYIMRKELRT